MVGYSGPPGDRAADCGPRLDQCLCVPPAPAVPERLCVAVADPSPRWPAEVIECAGGVFLSRPPRSAADRLMVISCLEDARHWPPVRRLRLPLVSAEVLLSGVLQQDIDLRRHELNV